VIVRVLGEGQYELDDDAVARVEAHDAMLSQALAADDEAWFAKALATLLADIRESGRRLDPTAIVPSDMAVPPEGASLEEVRALLAEGAPETS
jgi:hypothetical protein